MAAIALIMKLILQACILETGPSLNSMLDLHIVHVLVIFHTDFWVSQVYVSLIGSVNKFQSIQEDQR